MYVLRRMSAILALFIALTMFLAVSPSAHAKQDPIVFANVGWTGVTIKTAVTTKILDLIGYPAETKMLSVQLTYTALSMGDADVFLGNWMPSMKSISQKYFDDGSVVQLKANMPGANYTLAVPTYAWEAGLRDFSDIARFGDKLEHKIYGIEAGNDGNLIIQDMIDRDLFGLGDFKLVASSEPAMLAQVQTFAQDEKWVVFLGWGPHHMNEIIDMQYLTGSDSTTFGADDGQATVWTNVREGFRTDHPVVTGLLKNLVFPVEMMNKIMLRMHQDKSLSHLEAGMAYLDKHPDILEQWLEGVLTADGEPALPVVRKYLDKH